MILVARSHVYITIIGRSWIFRQLPCIRLLQRRLAYIRLSSRYAAAGCLRAQVTSTYCQESSRLAILNGMEESCVRGKRKEERGKTRGFDGSRRRICRRWEAFFQVNIQAANEWNERRAQQQPCQISRVVVQSTGSAVPRCGHMMVFHIFGLVGLARLYGYKILSPPGPSLERQCQGHLFRVSE